MAYSIGIANPIPSISSSTNFIEQIPITSPLTFNNGPPELPGLIEASICNTRITQSLLLVFETFTDTILSLPDKIPDVTLPR